MKKKKLAFAEGAYWKVLTPLEDSVEEPLNPLFKKPRVPTISKKDAEFVPVKHNFVKKFVCPQFSGVMQEIQLN